MRCKLAGIQNWVNPIGSWRQVGQLCFVIQYLGGRGEWKKRMLSYNEMDKSSKFALI